jgi:3-deoxy-7-phosphoheptulonate synthase
MVSEYIYKTKKKRTVAVGDVVFGEGTSIYIAGPCSVESKELLLATIKPIKDHIHMIRGGAFKPRTSPYSFQGLGKEGLAILWEVGRSLGLPVVTEVMSPDDITQVASFADMLQIGARNMQNYPLLSAAGKSGKPVLLKRGLSATLEEWFLAAEYILKEGNENVVLCERGIRSFDTATRNVFDLAGAVYAMQQTRLPVIADPSHATGVRSLIGPMIKASIAAGLSGVIVEVHADPEHAASDGHQSITPEDFLKIIE